LLASLITDGSKPAIARATALSLVPQYLSSASLPAVQAGLADNDALVRLAAVRALWPLSLKERAQLAAPLLSDSFRSVRIEAARLLAGTPPELFRQGQKAVLDSAVSEAIEAEMVSAERPESHLNLALMYTQMGRTHEAENELQTALRLDPNHIPSMMNLADLYRTQHREPDAQQLLEKAMAIAPDAGEPIHALGLLKARLGRQQEALALFAKASQLQPESVRFAYVYGVALHSYGEVEKAIAVLKKAHDARPADRDVLMALITFQRDKGDVPSAITYAEKLVQLNPADAQVIALRNSLNKSR
jgi:Flp pilus assembly protein TadD